MARGHEIHFASGQSCRKRMDHFNNQLSHFEDTAGKTIIFHDLGNEDCINDHNYMASASPEEFAEYKEILAEGPRNVRGSKRLIDLVMQGSLEGRKEVMDRFIDVIEELKPDILVLDQFTSCFIEAARVTGVDYIVTAPASPATLACKFCFRLQIFRFAGLLVLPAPSPFFEPLSGTDIGQVSNTNASAFYDSLNPVKFYTAYVAEGQVPQRVVFCKPNSSCHRPSGTQGIA
jgi:hypothetical protein